MKTTTKIKISIILLVIIAITYSFTTLDKIAINRPQALKNRTISKNLLDNSKVGKDDYIIYGTAKGLINGKKILLFTQNNNNSSLKLITTVVVNNGKFKISGKVTEPSFHFLQIETVKDKFPFIIENGDITIVLYKDSIIKSKVSGTYNNDEYVKFINEQLRIQKVLIDFQKKYTPIMTKAQKANDTVTINKLMKEFGEIQENVNSESKGKYITYVETHPKSFISVLIIQGMINDTAIDTEKLNLLYDSLDESLKMTKSGKELKLTLSKRD